MAIGGQSAPPSLKATWQGLARRAYDDYRGAVRPPFIEGQSWRIKWMRGCLYRGAVRPPFIEGFIATASTPFHHHYRGAVRPPFIEGLASASAIP